MINPELQKHIEQNIFPKYEKYYSHGMIHINNVIKNVLMLAEYYGLDTDMAYTMAAYHDIGLSVNREDHEHESGKIVEEDQELRKYFTPEQIQIIKEAVEDHRGSRKDPPRNIYGCILSDSDRDFDVEILAKRQLATSLKNYPDLTRFEDHFDRCYQYIMTRGNKLGNLWTDNPLLTQQRDKFVADYSDREYTRSIYKAEWDRITADGTMEKIINYYEDY